MIPFGPQDHQRLEREEIISWIEAAQSGRLNSDVLERLMPAREGSFLRPAPDDPLRNMTWWCHGFLEAAADHLVMWADYAAPLKVHSEAETVHALRPALTLARATIEAASQAIWVLSPEEPIECARRYIVIATWDLNEQLKAAGTVETRAELQSRRDEIFATLGVTTRTFRQPKYLDIIREAVEFLGAGDFAPAMSPDRAERVWRSASAAAHGKIWPDLELHDRTDVGDGLYSAVPKIDAISEAMRLAHRLLDAGVILFAIRAGKLDDFHTLWDEAVVRLKGRMTSLSGEPIVPAGDEPRTAEGTS